MADNLTHDEPFILHYLIQWLRSSDQNQNSDHLQSALHQPSPTWNYGGPHKMGRTAFLVQPAVFWSFTKQKQLRRNNLHPSIGWLCHQINVTFKLCPTLMVGPTGRSATQDQAYLCWRCKVSPNMKLIHQSSTEREAMWCALTLNTRVQVQPFKPHDLIDLLHPSMSIE